MLCLIFAAVAVQTAIHALRMVGPEMEAWAEWWGRERA